MNIEGSNLLSLLSGSENLGNFQQGLLTATGGQAGFAAAFMDQLKLLQGELASADAGQLATMQEWVASISNGVAGQEGGQNLSPLTALQNLAAKIPGGNTQSAMPDVAEMFGKTLPTAKKIDEDIDLDDTLQTLAEVMQQLQALEAKADEGSAILPSISDQQAQLTDEAGDAEQVGPQVAAEQVGPQVVAVTASQTSTVEEGQSGSADVVSEYLSAQGGTELPGSAKKPAGVSRGHGANGSGVVVSSGRDGGGESSGLEVDSSINTLLTGDAVPGKARENSSLDALKAQSGVARVDAQAVGGGEMDRAPSAMAADIAKLNDAVRNEARAEQPVLGKHIADPGWSKELGEKLIWMHKQDIPSVEVRLNPQHLGAISIRIDVNQDQASVAFTAQHLASKEAIEAAIPKLREMLGGQQLNLVDVNVSQQQSEQRQARDFFQMAGDQGQGRRSDTDDAQNPVVADAKNIADEIEAGRAIASNGLLSLFA